MFKSRSGKILAGFMLACLSMGSAHAYEPLVKKQSFEMAEFKTQGGKTIKDVKVGWEAYGKLNEAKDNVILIAHYFAGDSHAAGKYKKTDKAPGYWNSIIGSGKAIDTDKYYVISVDTLVNLGTGNPNVITTGPASINPDTKKPYGMSFPVVTIRDFVEVQKALLDSLGIKKLHAVMGASMGALQAYEWAASYPDMVERLIPVIASGWVPGNNIGWYNIWAAPIKVDPNWNNGDYYGKKPPIKGLTESLKAVILLAQHWEWSNGVFGRKWTSPKANPADNFDNKYLIETVLDTAGAARAKTSDANHFLYLVKANQLFYTGHGKSLYEGLKKIKARVLLIHTDEDLIFPGESVRETAAIIKSNGVPVEIFELTGTRGHLDGIFQISLASKTLTKFLGK